MPPQDPDYIEVEVLSPGGKNSRVSEPSDNPRADQLFAFIAKLMDSYFAIPGTNIRFGLDPILGLLPGLGDTGGALISAVLIFRGAQAGLPKIVLARMALNVLLNTLFGAIPVVGDAFSVWFKSNQLNYGLLQKHLSTPSASSKKANRKDWTFVICLLGGMLLLSVGILILSLTLLTALWKAAWGK